MLNKIKRTLAPPVFEDEKKSDLARLLHPVVLALFGATLLFALGFGPLNMFTGAHNRELASVVSAVMSILLGGALVLTRRGHLRMVSVLLTIMLFAGTTWAVYNFHGFSDASATGYFVLIAVAGLLFGGKVTVFYAVVSILTLSGMAYAEVSGYKSFPQPKNQLLQLIILSFSLGMTTVLIRFSTWRHKKALARSAHEIAERKRAEEALKISETRFRSLAEQSPFATLIYSKEGRLIQSNQAAADLWGLTPEEVKFLRENYNLLEDEQLETLGAMSYIKRGFAGNATVIPPINYTAEEIRATGTARTTARWVQSYIYPVKDEEGNFLEVVLMQENITERVQAEEALKESHESLLTILDSLDADIYVADMKNYEILFMNQHMRDSFGDNLVGKKCWEEFRGESGPCAHCTNDKLLDADGNPTGVYTWEIHNPITQKWYVNYDRAVKWVDDRLVRLQIATDITERKLAEEMMIQSEKMLTVGGLAAGMAHEINNPLAGILQNAQVMRNRLTGELPKNTLTAEACGTTMEAIEAYMNQRGIFSMIEAINESGHRAAQIVNNVLSFSRKSESRFVPHDLCDLLDRTLELASNDYDLRKKYDFRQIEIVREYDADLPEIPCEASQIQQVFLNILKNGAQAMAGVKDEGRWMKDESAPPRFTLRVDEEGDMARIEIEDNGPGMNEATRKRVFEPFFTTKGGGGTGLGMSVSYFIITENHGGTLSVESTLGKGVKFIIHLPLERKAE